MFETFGKLVQPSAATRDLKELSGDELNEIASSVKYSGMVLLRGFTVDLERFRRQTAN